jgi:CRISPR-associated protein Csm4
MGQLLWAAALLDGEDKVTRLIHEMDSQTPPFIVSSGLPAGMLPMPVLPPATLSADTDTVDYKRASSAKKFKKIQWISIDAWLDCHGALHPSNLFEYWQHKPQHFSDKIFKERIEPHNTIDRRSNAVLEGGLFFSTSFIFEGSPELDLYVKGSQFDLFERYMDFVACNGYGKDTSIGRGHFSYSQDKSFDSSVFDLTGNYEMLLSVFSAEDLTNLEGYYKHFVKRGRVWGELGGNTPFKRPILAFSEGSVFCSWPKSSSVFRNIHADPRVVQIMHPFTIPFTLEES